MATTIINEQIANGQIYANGYYGTGIANGYSFRAQSYAITPGSNTSNFTDQFQVQLTGYASAPATVYFYNYVTEDRIEVYQGNTLVASTSGAVNLTASDKVFLLSDNAGQFFNDSPDLYLRDFVAGSPGYASYAGKITWTHNPSGGTQYTIKALKGSGSYDWRYVVEYPIDGFTVGCPPLPPIYTPPPPTPLIMTPIGHGGGCGCGKIVCTAMNEQYGFGSFRQTVWLHQAASLDPAYEKGYHALFLPLVNYLYADKQPGPIKLWLKSMLEHVIKHRTADIWKQRKGKRDGIGSWYRAIFDPICYAVGRLRG